MVVVVNEDTLSAVLSEFARTLITDFPIQGILDHLVERIVDVLPVTAAGVTLISAGVAPRYVAPAYVSTYVAPPAYSYYAPPVYYAEPVVVAAPYRYYHYRPYGRVYYRHR